MMALSLMCFAVFPGMTAANSLQVDVASEINETALLETTIDRVVDVLNASGSQGIHSQLQHGRDNQQGPIMEWVQSWFDSDESNNLNGSAQLAVMKGNVTKDSASSSGEGHVVAIPLESQLLQGSPGSRAPRNSSAVEFVAQNKTLQHNRHEVSGAVVKVKLQSQLWQKSSGPKSNEDGHSTFLAPRSDVEHDASEQPSLITEFEVEAMKHCTVCMWLCIGLFVGCCCFSGAAHSSLGQFLGGFFNCILPLGVIIYVCHMTTLFSQFWNGKPICDWCMAICIWSFIQITCGLCFLGCSVLGVGVAALMGHETMEEKKQKM